MATQASRHGVNASPAMRFEIARGIFEAAQRDAHGALAQLDPYLMTGESVPFDLEQQMRSCQAKLSDAKANLDAAKMAMEACAEIEARTAAVKLIEDAPHNAVVVVQERQQLAAEHTRVSQREDDLAIERVALLRDRAELEDAVSKERARAAGLQRELLETQAYKRRLEQDLARSTEQILVAEKRATTAELSMRAEADLRLRAQRTDDSDRVRDMQNAYNHARQTARDHQQSFEEEMAHLKSQVKKARDDEQEAALLLEQERVGRVEAESTLIKERENTFDRQRRTDEEISNLTAALREAKRLQREAEAKAMDERESHNRVQDAANVERDRAEAAGAAAAAAARKMDQAQEQEASEGRRASSLEATLNEVKAELAEERRKRALAEATAAESFEKQTELDVSMKEAAAMRGEAEAAKDAIDGKARTLEESLQAAKNEAAQVRRDNGQLRNAIDAAKAALAAQKGSADAARERADWAEGEVGRLNRALADARDETTDAKRQIADLNRAMSGSASEATIKQGHLLQENAQLEADVRRLKTSLEHTEASERSARVRADEYAEEAKKLRGRMAGSMRAAQDVGEQRAAAAEEEAADVKAMLDQARREVRELTDECAALRDKHADALMKCNGEKAAAVAAAEGVSADLRHELGMVRAQLATARAANTEAGDEVSSLRNKVEETSNFSAKQLAAMDLQATERQKNAVAAAVANAVKLAEIEKQTMVAGFDATIEELGAAVRAAREEAAKHKAEAESEKERADTATQMRDRATQNAAYADDDAERSRRIAIKLQEANTQMGNEKELATAAAVGDAAGARAAADRIGLDMAEARRQAATDRNRALKAERALDQQTKLAEIAGADAERAAARAQAAEDRAAAAESRAKRVAGEAARGDQDAMAVLDARLRAEQEASEAKRAAREALKTVDVARASQQSAQEEMATMRRNEQLRLMGGGGLSGSSSGTPAWQQQHQQQLGVSQYAGGDVAAARARDAAIAKARGLAEAQEAAMGQLRGGSYHPVVAASEGAEGMKVRALGQPGGKPAPGAMGISTSYTL